MRESCISLAPARGEPQLHARADEHRVSAAEHRDNTKIDKQMLDQLTNRDVDNLTKALASSRQIGTAIGLLMTAHQVSSEAAFALLRRASNDLNRKLRDVAADVEKTGHLPS